jgi:hypothetical protein
VTTPAPGQTTGVLPRPPRLGAVAAGAVSLLLTGSLVFVFPFGLLIAPLGAIPVVQLAAAGRRSIAAWGWVVAVLAGAVVVTSLGGDATSAVAVLVGYGLIVVLPAVSIEAWRSSGSSDGRWIAIATACVAVLSTTVVIASVWPQDPVAGVSAGLRQATTHLEAFYQGMNIPRSEVDQTVDLIERALAWGLPSMVVAYLVAVLFWLRSRLPLLGFPLPIEPFERWRNDEWLAAAFVVTGVGTLVLAGTWRWIAVNLLVAVLILYFTQGLAMIRAHLARLVGRGWLVRWAVALVCLQVPLVFIVAALGVADSFANLRPRANPDGRNA